MIHLILILTNYDIYDIITSVRVTQRKQFSNSFLRLTGWRRFIPTQERDWSQVIKCQNNYKYEKMNAEPPAQ